MSNNAVNKGKIIQIIGSVLDIDFSGGSLPSINNAIEIKRKTNDGTEYF